MLGCEACCTTSRTRKLLTLVAQNVFLEPPPAIDEPGMPGTPSSAIAICEAFTTAAATKREHVIARWFAAIAAERAGDPVAAEQHLEIAHSADPSQSVARRPPGVVRLRPRRRRTCRPAVERAQRRPIPSDRIDRSWQRRGGCVARNPGGTSRCWCGSGRKYKQCHNGQAQPAAVARSGRLALPQGVDVPRAPRGRSSRDGARHRPNAGARPG